MWYEKYKLLDAEGKEYYSETPGLYGGNSKLKIYGRLDCPSALSTIRRFPGSYEKAVFSLQMRRTHSPPVIDLVEIACVKSIKNI